jgi:hypothetical protein
VKAPTQLFEDEDDVLQYLKIVKCVVLVIMKIVCFFVIADVMATIWNVWILLWK